MGPETHRILLSQGPDLQILQNRRTFRGGLQKTLSLHQNCGGEICIDIGIDIGGDIGGRLRMHVVHSE